MEIHHQQLHWINSFQYGCILLVVATEYAVEEKIATASTQGMLQQTDPLVPANPELFTLQWQLERVVDRVKFLEVMAR